MAAREHEDLVYDPSIADIIDFVFPRNLQHPLSTSRLYCYSLCGPLDKHHKLRCGIRGRKVLYEYELEEMCLQYEREDIIQIYLHNPRNFGTLTAKEQEMIISQADGHLKRAKGKSYLPPINREEVYLMLMALPQRESEIVCFHDVQNAVNKFRENRIKKFKLVYPELGTMKNLDQEKLPSAERRKIRKIKSSTAVSEAVAPSTMFRHMEGLRSADQTDMMSNHLSKHAFKIAAVNQMKDPAICSNIQLIREIYPKYEDPYVRCKNGNRVKEEWNSTSNLAKSGLGSLVKASLSTTTWQPKFTKY